MTVLKIESLA